MKSKKLLYRLLAFAAAPALLLAACGNGGEEAGVADGENAANSETSVPENTDSDTLIIGVSNNIDSLNPFQRTGTQSTYVQRFFYETLLNMVGPTEYEPRLGSIESTDNQVFTITLDEEAYWTDGEPVTSEDVVYSINTTAHPDTMTSQATNIAMIEGTGDNGKLPEGADEVTGVEVLDEKTLELTTKEPLDINYLSEFFGFNFIIAPEHVFSQYEPADIHTSEDATNPTVTNGAFKFVENSENNYVHVEANEDYYKGAPELQNVYIRVLSGTAMLTELQSGSIDMIAGGGISSVAPSDVQILEDVDHLEVNSYPSVGIQYIIPNTESEFFGDPTVRRAFAHAIDRELAVENLLLGNGEVPATPYTSSSAYKVEDIEPIPYDPDEAARLLEEANFDFSQPVTFIVPTGNATREQMADLVYQNLQDIGVNVQMETYDFTSAINAAREGNFDISIFGMSHYYDPNLQNYYGTGGGTNMGFYSDEHMDALIQEGNTLTTFEERYDVYEEIQEYFIEEMPTIPLYSDYTYSIQDENLVGGVSEFWSESFATMHEWHFSE